MTDGELMRLDPTYAETNGMVDYFISRMDGISNERAVHICVGNQGGQPMRRGFWFRS